MKQRPSKREAHAGFSINNCNGDRVCRRNLL